DGAGHTCGKFHTQHRCFSRLDDAWRAQFDDEAERPHWLELLRSGVDIFALDYDDVLAAMYALSVTAEGDCYLCVPPDPGIEAVALGASESALSGTAPAEALHTFTLDSGASRCLFRDSTTLTPLPAPVPAKLVDPSGGPILARSTTVLLCLAVPSSSLSGLHLPLFSTNLVSTAALQDEMVTTTTPGGQRVSICTCTPTGRHLATFTHRPGSSLYTLTTEPTQVAASPQVSASGPVAAPFSCRLLSHQTLLLAPPPWSLPRLSPSPALPCLPCVQGRQRAAPHPSFPSTTAPLQTLHMDAWGPARVTGQDRECYFMLVVGDYTRYTTVFPLRSKGEVPDALIPWIRTVHLQLRERFLEDLPVLRLHSSDLLREFSPHWRSHVGGRLRSGTLRISSTSGPVSPCSETSPTLRWMGKVGDASVFPVWGSPSFVRDTSADKLSSRATPCDVTFDESVPFYRLFLYRTAPLPPPPPLFLAPGPPPVDPLPPHGPAPSGVSQVDPLPLSEPVEVTVDSGAARGAASGGAEPASAEPRCAEPASAEPKGAELEGTEAGGAESEGAESGGAEPEGAEPGGAEPKGAEPGGAESEGAEFGGAELEGAEPGGAEPKGAEPGGAESEGAESGGAEPRGTTSAGGPAGALPLALQELDAMPMEALELEELELEALPLEALELEVLVLIFSEVLELLLELEVLGVLKLLVLKVLVLEVLELPELVVLEALELETLELEALELETLELEAVALEALDLELEMASWKSTGTYVDAVPPPRANIFYGMWIFRVKRPSGSPPVFKAHYVARGFSQRQGVDFFQTCSPTPKMTTLQVLLHVAAQRDYELHSLDFSTNFLQGSLHEEILLRRPLGFTGSFPACTQWSLRWPVYGLRQVPHEWHDTLKTTLAALGFTPTADLLLFLCTDTSLPLFYVLVYVLQRFGFRYSLPQSTPLPTGHSLSAPPSDESVEPSGPYPELVGCLMYLITCTRPDLAYPLSILARYVAPGRHRPEHWEAAKRVLHYLCSTSGMGHVFGGRDQFSSLDMQTLLCSSYEAEIYAGAMAAQELR
ncbi:unnamed protein product, partial [Closterium sp. NIES-53]